MSIKNTEFTLSPQEFFELIGKDALSSTERITKDREIDFAGYKVYRDSWRYRTFYQKGCTCAKCGKKGKYFQLDINTDCPNRGHFNLYAEDGTLMTKDHIMPRSLGGKDCIENFQTYCELCNNKKGNKIDF